MCVDEKAQIQALDRSQLLLPMRPGQAARRTPDYRRHSTINLFAALDAKAGTVIGEFHRRHRTVKFRSFLETVEPAVPGELELHLILIITALTRLLPSSAGWCAIRASICTLRPPAAPGSIWSSAGSRCSPKSNCAAGAPHPRTGRCDPYHLERHNRHPEPFIWTNTADQILDRSPDLVNEFHTQDTSYEMLDLRRYISEDCPTPPHPK